MAAPLCARPHPPAPRARLRTARRPPAPRRPRAEPDAWLPTGQFPDEDEEDDERSIFDDEDLQDISEADLARRFGYTGNRLLSTDKRVGSDVVGPDGKPQWLRCACAATTPAAIAAADARARRDLEADIENDPEVREVLEGANGDPEKVRRNMRERLKRPAPSGEEVFTNDSYGVDKPMRVVFRGMDPMAVYVRVGESWGVRVWGERGRGVRVSVEGRAWVACWRGVRTAHGAQRSGVRRSRAPQV